MNVNSCVQNEMNQLFLKRYTDLDVALEKYVASVNVFDIFTLLHCFRLKCLGYDVASFRALEKDISQVLIYLPNLLAVCYFNNLMLLQCWTSRCN